MKKQSFLISTITLALCLVSVTVFSATYYVSKNGNDANDGTSWASAYLSIKTGLSKTVSGDNLWVAAGTYTEGETIQIAAGVSVFGGFAGNETSLEDRDTTVNITIIDGKRSYQCITNYGLMDNLSVTKGENVTGTAGVVNYGSVNNCDIYYNGYSLSGGGVYNHGTINYCTISNNFSYQSGGGVYNASTGIINHCAIEGNRLFYPTGASMFLYTTKSGAGIYNEGTVTNCMISKNIIDAQGADTQGANALGGGIYNSGTTVNCIISENSASSSYSIGTYYPQSTTSYGGGVYNNENGVLTNCIIQDNNAKSKVWTILPYGVNFPDSNGAGLYNNGTVTNCTITQNSASSEISSTSGPVSGNGIYNHKGTVTNCIVWKNPEEDIHINTGTISYTCFSESDGSNNNINSDPLFLDGPTTETIVCDLHLQAGSPCIDTGTTVSLFQDIEGLPRPLGSGWDMGAYEYYQEKPGDINLDGILNDSDISYIEDSLSGMLVLQPYQEIAADFNKDGKIDIADIVSMINYMNSLRVGFLTE